MTIDLGPLAMDAAAGTWAAILDRLGVELAVRHTPYGSHPTTDYLKWRALCYFVGGPWDRREMWIGLDLARPGGVIRVPLPCDPGAELGGYFEQQVMPFEERCVDYIWASPLPSGVPVFSCLCDCLGNPWRYTD